jgi:lipid A 3-O-deacylase
MILRRIGYIAPVLCAFAGAPAHAIDGVSVEIGGGDGVDMGRIGVQWNWNKRWLQAAAWHLGGYWDVAAGYWHRGNVRPGEHDEIVDLGITPVFRIQPNGLAGPYLEAAIGLHLLSHTSIGDRRMSTAFQFGDHIGVGYRFGAKGSYDLGYRYQHLSNASIKRPNPGINFHQIRMQYAF